MFGKNLIRKSLAIFIAVAVWSLSSMMVLAASPAKSSGDLVASGNVTVNGQAVSGSTTVISGSTINTGDNSSAVINLGKLGKIEVSQTATLTLNFTESAINIGLDAGRVKIMSMAGIAANVTTKDGSASADSSQANNFALTVECSFTNVETQSGLVVLSSAQGKKQVAAGTEASLGVQQTGCEPCLRPIPGGGTVPTTSFLGAGLLGLLLAAGGAVGTAVVIGTSGGGSDINGGGSIVVSPTR